MKLIKSILILTLIAFTSSCATDIVENTQEPKPIIVTVNNSEFDKNINILGPLLRSHTKRNLISDEESLILMASQSKETKKINYSIYIVIEYTSDWRFYQSMSFKDTSSIELEKGAEKVKECHTSLGCSHTEEMIAEIPLSKLDPTKDLVFRLNSKSGETNIITVPKAYIAGVLDGIKANIK